MRRTPRRSDVVEKTKQARGGLIRTQIFRALFIIKNSTPQTPPQTSAQVSAGYDDHIMSSLQDSGYSVSWNNNVWTISWAEPTNSVNNNIFPRATELKGATDTSSEDHLCDRITCAIEEATRRAESSITVDYQLTQGVRAELTADGFAVTQTGGKWTISWD